VLVARLARLAARLARLIDTSHEMVLLMVRKMPLLSVARFKQRLLLAVVLLDPALQVPWFARGTTLHCASCFKLPKPVLVVFNGAFNSLEQQLLLLFSVLYRKVLVHLGLSCERPLVWLEISRGRVPALRLPQGRKLADLPVLVPRPPGALPVEL
jgi:hypothetical protein